MATSPLIWVDGKIVRASDAPAPITGHAVQRGSLVFDVGSFHASALFRCPEHVARFRRSARLVGLELTPDDATLIEAARAVVRESKLTTGLVRWSVLYAVSEPDIVPQDPSTRVIVAASTLDDATKKPPLRVMTFTDAQKAPPNVLSPEVKAAGAYLGPLIAKRRAIAAGANDVVLLDEDGDIAEAPIANAFAVIDGTLWTPPLGRILPGITRDSVLVLAREMGIVVREERLPRQAFVSANEAFLTSTSMPLGPIGAIDGVELAAPGPVTTRLRDALVRAELERSEWLLPI